MKTRYARTQLGTCTQPSCLGKLKYCLDAMIHVPKSELTNVGLDSLVAISPYQDGQLMPKTNNATMCIQFRTTKL
jgi:hypothetical protein